MQQSVSMATYKDFASWAGGQAKAGRLIGVNRARAHRLYHGAELTPAEAMQIELVSGGAFRKEALIFGPLIRREPDVMGGEMH